MKKILCVCLGNICRSPVAEAVLRQKLLEDGQVESVDFELDSAGTGDWHVGEAPDIRAIKTCENHEIDISQFQARELAIEDGEAFDFILGMDNSNLEHMKKIIPLSFYDKIRLFDDTEVKDPYWSEIEAFEVMFEQLEQASISWVKKLF